MKVFGGTFPALFPYFTFREFHSLYWAFQSTKHFPNNLMNSSWIREEVFHRWNKSNIINEYDPRIRNTPLGTLLPLMHRNMHSTPVYSVYKDCKTQFNTYREGVIGLKQNEMFNIHHIAQNIYNHAYAKTRFITVHAEFLSSKAPGLFRKAIAITSSDGHIGFHDTESETHYCFAELIVTSAVQVVCSPQGNLLAIISTCRSEPKRTQISFAVLSDGCLFHICKLIDLGRRYIFTKGNFLDSDKVYIIDTAGKMTFYKITLDQAKPQLLKYNNLAVSTIAYPYWPSLSKTSNIKLTAEGPIWGDNCLLGRGYYELFRNNTQMFRLGGELIFASLAYCNLSEPHALWLFKHFGVKGLQENYTLHFANSQFNLLNFQVGASRTNQMFITVVSNLSEMHFTGNDCTLVRDQPWTCKQPHYPKNYNDCTVTSRGYVHIMELDLNLFPRTVSMKRRFTFCLADYYGGKSVIMNFLFSSQTNPINTYNNYFKDNNFVISLFSPEVKVGEQWITLTMDFGRTLISFPLMLNQSSCPYITNCYSPHITTSAGLAHDRIFTTFDEDNELYYTYCYGCIQPPPRHLATRVLKTCRCLNNYIPQTKRAEKYTVNMMLRKYREYAE